MAFATQTLFPSAENSTNFSEGGGAGSSPIYDENLKLYTNNFYNGTTNNPTQHIKDGTILPTFNSFLTPSGLNGNNISHSLIVAFSGLRVMPSSIIARLVYDFTTYSGTSFIQLGGTAIFYPTNNPILFGAVSTHSSSFPDIHITAGTSGVAQFELYPTTEQIYWFPASGNVINVEYQFTAIGPTFNSGQVRYIDMDIIASGIIGDINSNCNLYCQGRTPNPPLITQVLLPNTGIPSYWSGSGLKIPQGTFLQDSPTTGSDSIANSVKDGTTNPTFNNYWTNPGLGTSDVVDGWFELGFDKMNIGAPSGVTARFVHNRNSTLSAAQVALSGANLYYKKNNNPNLTNDILFASGELVYTSIGLLSGIVNCRFLIVDANRPLFPLNGYLSLSGHLLNSTSPFNAASGNFNFYDWDLIASGTSIIDGISLYMSGQPGSISGMTNLYTSGIGRINDSMNLYTSGPSTVVNSGYIPLFTYSTTNSGKFATLPLVLGYQGGTPDPRNSLPLYLKNNLANQSVNSLNLFTKNDNSIIGQVNLFTQNNYTTINSGVNLYTAAPSGIQGAVPYSGNMNLFIARDTQGLYGGVPLFTQVNNSSNYSTPLFISGANIQTGNVNLYQRAIDSGTIQNLNLYSRGF